MGALGTFLTDLEGVVIKAILLLTTVISGYQFLKHKIKR